MRADHSPGVALMVCGLALLSASILEFAAGDARGDGDNPAQSLEYFAQFGYLYTYSGLALVVGAASLLVGVIGVHRLIRVSRISLAFEVITVVGVLSGGFLAVSGVMRMQATGTVPHIQGLDQAWGEAAYLALQITGTQGLLSAGFIALASWLVGLAILCWRRGLRGLTALAILPAFVLAVLTVDLALPFLTALAGGTLFVGYIAGIVVGIPAGCFGFGIALVRTAVRTRLAAIESPPLTSQPS